MKVWEIRSDGDGDFEEYGTVYRSASETAAKHRLSELRAEAARKQALVDAIDKRMDRLVRASQDGRLGYRFRGLVRQRIVHARQAACRGLVGERHPSATWYELVGPYELAAGEEVNQPGRTYTKDQIRTAVNASCTCGGGGPDDCCPACAVWHTLGAGR